jgi:membrane protein YdbS with pleckstrin-like domain
MSLRLLQLLLIILASVLLGVIITFSLFYVTDPKLVAGSAVFTLALLLFLTIQLREIKAEQ